GPAPGGRGDRSPRCGARLLAGRRPGATRMTALDDSAPRGSGSAQGISGDDATEGRDVTDRNPADEDTLGSEAISDGETVGAQTVSEDEPGDDADTADAASSENRTDLPD